MALAGKPSCLARSTMAKVMPPPVEVPNIPIFLGAVVFTTSL